MKRIILHWTGGVGRPNATDRRHYHKIIAAGGTVVLGNHPPEANRAPIARPNDGSTYAAHTRGANSDAIGIALAGMRNAKKRPFDPGDHPITLHQIDAALAEVASDCRKYGIEVERDTVLTHAEVEPTLGIKQSGQWDITWIPGMDRPGDPVAVGDVLRGRLLTMFLRPVATPVPPMPEPVAFWQAIAALLRQIFGGRA